jgi:hypothetical protein
VALPQGLVGLARQVTWCAKHFGVWHDLTSETTTLEPPSHFQVTMIQGIFRSMQADHLFRALPSGATEMKDIFSIAAPLPLLGPLAETLFLRRYMLAPVRERNAVIKQVAESSRVAARPAFPCSIARGRAAMKIVIPGGTGQVGHILARHFHQKGHAVTVLSRSPHAAPWRVIPWDGVTLGPWIGELERSDACINLAGSSVNYRYTPANRRSIFESRVRSTQILNQAIATVQHPPSVWLNASTATIYRHALDRPMDEATGEFGGDEPGLPDTWNFSIRVAKAWEEAFSPPQLLGRGRSRCAVP